MLEHGVQKNPLVIAIGATAGGWETCRALLKDMLGDDQANSLPVLIWLAIAADLESA